MSKTNSHIIVKISTIMVFPTFEDIMLPLLKFAKDGKTHSVRDAEYHLSQHFQLTEKQRQKQKESGTEPLFLHRVRWARTYLKRAGLIFDPKLGQYEITDLGLKILEKKPQKINIRYLLNFPNFKKWYERNEVLKKKSIKKIDSDVEEENGIIIFLDVLGIKGIWRREDSKVLQKKWANFTKSVEDVIKLEFPKNKVSFYTFSDTIIITIISETPERILLKLSSSIAYSIIISMLLGLPLRGCISVGKFFQHKTLVIGEAIDEAASYYELPQWIGVSCAPSANEIIDRIGRSEPHKLEGGYARCEIPLKTTIEQNAWVVDWTWFSDDLIYENSEHSAKRKYIDTLDLLHEELGQSNDISSSLKWRNTIKFYEDIQFEIEYD